MADEKKTVKQLENDILEAKLSMKLIAYAEEITPKIMRGETIEGITIKHSRYVLNYLREFLQKDYGV